MISEWNANVEPKPYLKEDGEFRRGLLSLKQGSGFWPLEFSQNLE